MWMQHKHDTERSSKDHGETHVTWNMKSIRGVSIESYYCYRMRSVGSDIRDTSTLNGPSTQGSWGR